MENALSSLLSLPVLIFCVIVFLLVQGFKKVVVLAAKQIAYVFPDKYEPWFQWFWGEMILPVVPLLFGGLVALFVKDYPYPELFAQSDSARVFFGIVGGLISGFLYPRFMFYYKKFMPAKVDEKVEELTE